MKLYFIKIRDLFIPDGIGINLIYLISTELKALEEISKMCGEIKVKTGKDDKEKEETRPLITISDLQKLKMNEVIIRRLRMAPFKTKLTPDYKMNWGRTYKLASTSDIKERPKHEVKVFDIKKFVDDNKKNNNPFASGFPTGGGFGSGSGIPSPFAGGFNSPYPDLFGGNLETKNDFDFPSTPKEQESKIDIDRLLKNIDAKIAELEEEEKIIDQEESSKKKNTIISSPKDDIIIEQKDKENSSNSQEDFKSLITSFNDEQFIETKDNNPFEKQDTPKNIDELIDKIKEQSDTKENIKPNMNLVEENKYKEVSDDEFFDDFFD